MKLSLITLLQVTSVTHLHGDAAQLYILVPGALTQQLRKQYWFHKKHKTMQLTLPPLRQNCNTPTLQRGWDMVSLPRSVNQCTNHDAFDLSLLPSTADRYSSEFDSQPNLTWGTHATSPFDDTSPSAKKTNPTHLYYNACTCHQAAKICPRHCCLCLHPA